MFLHQKKEDYRFTPDNRLTSKHVFIDSPESTSDYKLQLHFNKPYILSGKTVFTVQVKCTLNNVPHSTMRIWKSHQLQLLL